MTSRIGGAPASLARSLRLKIGGKGIRTPGLLIANETLYQLSYTPIVDNEISTPGGFEKVGEYLYRYSNWGEIPSGQQNQET
jgi:hypothetical protein